MGGRRERGRSESERVDRRGCQLEAVQLSLCRHFILLSSRSSFSLLLLSLLLILFYHSPSFPAFLHLSIYFYQYLYVHLVSLSPLPLCIFQSFPASLLSHSPSFSLPTKSHPSPIDKDRNLIKTLIEAHFQALREGEGLFLIVRLDKCTHITDTQCMAIQLVNNVEVGKTVTSSWFTTIVEKGRMKKLAVVAQWNERVMRNEEKKARSFEW